MRRGVWSGMARIGGYLEMAVHGFGIITFAQSAWLMWVGVLLWRGEKPEKSAGSDSLP
ncbi:MAG TPA: hypothetical protein VMM77_12075 [Gemmatimonadaceae bacterium]|nr:hypothetical protein [Gemmatimonadaceae bacterium]